MFAAFLLQRVTSTWKHAHVHLHVGDVDVDRVDGDDDDDVLHAGCSSFLAQIPIKTKPQLRLNHDGRRGGSPTLIPQ